MTKKEIAEIIESKAAEYGFEIEENSMGWNNKRTGQDYINIQIFQNSNLEKTDWENHKACIEYGRLPHNHKETEGQWG